MFQSPANLWDQSAARNGTSGALTLIYHVSQTIQWLHTIFKASCISQSSVAQSQRAKPSIDYCHSRFAYQALRAFSKTQANCLISFSFPKHFYSSLILSIIHLSLCFDHTHSSLSLGLIQSSFSLGHIHLSFTLSISYLSFSISYSASASASAIELQHQHQLFELQHQPQLLKLQHQPQSFELQFWPHYSFELLY